MRQRHTRRLKKGVKYCYNTVSATTMAGGAWWAELSPRSNRLMFVETSKNIESPSLLSHLRVMKSLSGISNAPHAEYVKPSCIIASPDPLKPHDSCPSLYLICRTHRSNRQRLAPASWKLAAEPSRALPSSSQVSTSLAASSLARSDGVQQAVPGRGADARRVAALDVGGNIGCLLVLGYMVIQEKGWCV